MSLPRIFTQNTPHTSTTFNIPTTLYGNSTDKLIINDCVYARNPKPLEPLEHRTYVEKIEEPRLGDIIKLPVGDPREIEVLIGTYTTKSSFPVDRRFPTNINNEYTVIPSITYSRDEERQCLDVAEAYFEFTGTTDTDIPGVALNLFEFVPNYRVSQGPTKDIFSSKDYLDYLS